MGLITTLASFFPVGFHMRESMIGTHQFEPGMGPPGNLPMRFDVDWGTNDITKGTTMALNGAITIEGLVERAPCYGSLELNYLSEGKLRYTIFFKADGPGHQDFGEYKYVGEKVNIKPWNLPVSHTTCFGTLTDAYRHLVSRSVTHFKMSTALDFISSLEVDFGG